MDYNVTYRKKDKSIQCIISYKDNDGKWRQKSKQGFARQKDAKSWIDETIDKLKETIKTPEEFKGITFGKFKEMFINNRKKEYSFNTLSIYKKAFAKFKSLDPIPLTDVSYIHIKPCVDEMLAEGLKGSTVTLYLSKIKAVFNHAIEDYEIPLANPVRNKQYKLPKEEKTEEIKALNANELEDLLSKLDGEDYMVSLIASKCGLRIGEVIGLVDTDFDFKKAEINIHKQWKLLNNGSYGLGTLKSHNSYRTALIPKNYVSEIKKYVKSCVKDMNRRIFIDDSTSVVGVRLGKKYKKLGYDISVHDLRHTYATTLLARGFDYKTVSELIGDTVEVVIDTYSHFINDMMESAKTRIDNIL